MKGRFLVFEGIDGCGKSTQINQLINWLPTSGLMPQNSVLHVTREPGGTALGNALRELLLHPPKEILPGSLSELLLYSADRAQHVLEVITPALENGDWIISDRFSGSTIAYQGYGRELNLDLILQLEKIATQGLVPDITFWLDLSVEESLDRRKNTNHDRIESEGATFLGRVANGFDVLAKERNWTRVPANLPKEVVAKKIKESLSIKITGKRISSNG
ncbi:dTMP kinase [Prochlorococcus sp. MIT 1307]|uniref:dTMP kinase n=1 Tax=Prochlorococcus sp. MIT 1307 TaxID=3096219 RepID=UPI002A7669DA|nr:dTMP kinase [Prochlorococcus sp. MIT 1307]